MSNKIVPNVYRSIIDDVLSNIEPEFREYGVSDAVLRDLETRWVDHVMKSQVADFEPAAPPPAQIPAPPHLAAYQPQHQTYQLGPPHAYPPPHAASTVPSPVTNGTVKNEPLDNRYALSNGSTPTPANFALPPLPGPQLNGRTAQNATTLSFPTPGQSVPQAQPQAQPQQSSQQQQQPQRYTPQPAARIPQVDGPSSSGSISDEDQRPYAPRAAHPSLPQPIGGSRRDDDDEAINSDLDDSDTEGDADAGDETNAADGDIMFCTYDKVARVKNKWKCVLKDGVIHVNGKDYLFAKCTGEFEW